MAGVVDGVVPSDELHTLPEAIVALEAGLRILARRIAVLSGLMPPVSDRQRLVLRHLMRGRPYKAIARLTCVSEATVKRELGELCSLFAVSDRAELISAAIDAGVTA